MSFPLMQYAFCIRGNRFLMIEIIRVHQRYQKSLLQPAFDPGIPVHTAQDQSTA